MTKSNIIQFQLKLMSTEEESKPIEDLPTQEQFEYVAENIDTARVKCSLDPIRHTIYNHEELRCKEIDYFLELISLPNHDLALVKFKYMPIDNGYDYDYEELGFELLFYIDSLASDQLGEMIEAIRMHLIRATTADLHLKLRHSQEMTDMENHIIELKLKNKELEEQIINLKQLFSYLHIGINQTPNKEKLWGLQFSNPVQNRKG